MHNADDVQILFQAPGVTIALSRHAETLVPYSPVERADGNRNHGFLDLRDNPAGVEVIPEAAKLRGLADLLRAVAIHPELMTSGCEAAVFDKGVRLDRPRFQAGSFVMIMFRDANRNRDIGRFAGLADRTLRAVSPSPDNFIGFEFVIEPLKTFFGEADCYALQMKALGYGPTEEAAWRELDYAMSSLAAAIPPSPGVALDGSE